MAAAAVVCLVVLAGLVSSCGGDDPELVEAEPTADETPTPQPSPTPPSGGADTGPTPTPPPPPSGSGTPGFTSGSKVTTVGIDAVIFGMTLTEAAEAQGTVFEPVDQATGSCYVVQPFNGPEGITLTVVDGRVERIDITTDLLTTRSGAGVGRTVEELRDLFGGQLFEQVTPTGATYQFVPLDENDQAYRLYFETEDGVVTRYRAGRVPVVNPIAPCG